MAKMSVFVDTSKCIGCRGCEVACKNWNDLDWDKKPFTGNYQTKTGFAPRQFMYVQMHEAADSDGSVKWLFTKSQCMHCTDAACVEVCPKGALSHNELGAVVRDVDKCIGCGYCVQACPFHVPKLDTVASKATKCTMCENRLANGYTPACAKTCPTGALQYGDRDELVAKAQARLEEVKATNPSARLYGVNELKGTNFFYLLKDEPPAYGLPSDPKFPWQIRLWKYFLRPLGELAAFAGIGMFLLAIIGNYIWPASYKGGAAAGHGASAEGGK